MDTLADWLVDRLIDWFDEFLLLLLDDAVGSQRDLRELTILTIVYILNSRSQFYMRIW